MVDRKHPPGQSFTTGKPGGMLEVVPAAIAFDVDPADTDEAGFVYAHNAFGEFTGFEGEPLVEHAPEEPGIPMPRAFAIDAAADPAPIFVAYKLVLTEPDCSELNVGRMTRNRFRFTIAGRCYGEGSLELARCGLVYHRGLTVPAGKALRLRLTVHRAIPPTTLRFYLIGEWGRPIR